MATIGDAVKTSFWTESLVSRRVIVGQEPWLLTTRAEKMVRSYVLGSHAIIVPIGQSGA